MLALSPKSDMNKVPCILQFLQIKSKPELRNIKTWKIDG